MELSSPVRTAWQVFPPGEWADLPNADGGGLEARGAFEAQEDSARTCPELQVAVKVHQWITLSRAHAERASVSWLGGTISSYPCLARRLVSQGHVAEGRYAQLHVILQDEPARVRGKHVSGNAWTCSHMRMPKTSRAHACRWNNMLDNNFADNRNWGCHPPDSISISHEERKRLLEVLMSSGT